MQEANIMEFVERAKKGDEAAVEHLYHLHSRKIYSLCLRMTSNQAEAEDLTQEVFLRAFRKLHTFRGDSAFSTWLYRLGTNVVLMRLRKKARPEVSLEEQTRPNGSVAAALRAAAGPDATETLVDRMTLRLALEALPEGFRKVVVLHDFEGYCHHEIAELTGRSIGNSKSQLHKAHRRLRELLSAPCPVH